MKTRLSLTSLVALLSGTGTVVAWPAITRAESLVEDARHVARNVSEYNLSNRVALKGYDPVSYFPEGGGSPRAGAVEHMLDYEGAIYFFVSHENMETFKKAPTRFEPTYGGWCAYAMSFGSKVDIKPELFTISGNRIHFFVSRRAKANFDSDVEGHEDRADGFWKKISGEEPRF